MAYWIYSTEALPNEKLMGKPGYTPDGDCIKWNGATLPVLKAMEWQELPESIPLKFHRDWKDRQGYDVDVYIRRFKGIIDAKFAERGVIFLDHKPSEEEKKTLEAVSLDLNMKFRKKAIEFFEDQREMAKQRQGTYPVTPYIDECYELLGIKKPYSLEALESLRDPGAKAAKQIADALSGVLNRQNKERDEAIEKLTKELVAKPEEPRVPAARR